MATADELLSLMSTDGDDKTLVIDNYLRKITIPKGITCLGVEYDDDVLQLDFKMPRYFGDIDLSKFSIRVNYLNAQGEGDVYTVKNPTVTSSSILFTWIVGPTATTYKGDTKFNVCLKLMTSDGYIDKEYNTTIATLPVLEGLETDERVISEYSDILEQWKNELFGISDTEEASMRAVSAEEQENIAQKGAEVLATIPEEYQETAEAAQEGIRTKADAIICSAEGETITVSDSSDDHIRGLRVFGKTTQVSTTGTNLFNPYAEQNTSFGTATVENNGAKITVTGTYYVSWPLVLKAGVTYYIDFTTVGTATNRAIRFEYPDKEITGTITNPASFTPTKDTVSVYLYAGLGTEGTIVYENVQISEGSSAIPWEPYSGGFASPSPDWAQPLESLTDVNATVAGKNLLNITTGGEALGVTETVTNGLVSFSGTATGNGGRILWKRSDEIVLYPGTYILKATIPSGTAPTPCLSRTGGHTLVANGQNTVFTLNEATTVFLGFNYILDRVYDAENVAVQLEVGDTATDYEPFKDTQTVSLTNYTLPGIPVTSGGNYTDADGQQWICDEIDFERGVYVQRINRTSLTGDETYGLLTDSGGEMFVTIPLEAAYTNSAVTCKCNHYPAVARQDTYDNGATVGFIGLAISHHHARITDNVNFNGDSDALQTWVAEKTAEGNPLIIEYILATPIETPLTAEELKAFKALKTNYPHTTVMNDAGAHMELKYNADTKTYVDNGIKQTVNDVLEAIENGSY